MIKFIEITVPSDEYHSNTIAKMTPEVWAEMKAMGYTIPRGWYDGPGSAIDILVCSTIDEVISGSSDFKRQEIMLNPDTKAEYDLFRSLKKKYDKI